MTWLLNLHPLLSISKLSLFSFVFVVEPLLPCAWTQLESNQIIIFWLRLFPCPCWSLCPITHSIVLFDMEVIVSCCFQGPTWSFVLCYIHFNRNWLSFLCQRYVENLECNYASTYFSNENKFRLLSLKFSLMKYIWLNLRFAKGPFHPSHQQSHVGFLLEFVLSSLSLTLNTPQYLIRDSHCREFISLPTI